MRIAPLAALLLFAPLAFPQPYTPAGLDDALHELDTAIDSNSTGTASALPRTWDVRTADGDFSIPTAPLAAHLRKSDPAAAHLWIQQLRTHLEQSGLPSRVNEEEDRVALRSILARAEFRQNRPPSTWDQLVARIRGALYSWIIDLLSFVKAHPTGSMVLFWTLIGAAVVGLLAFLAKLWMGNDAIPTQPRATSTGNALRAWQEWVQEARAAAARSDYGQAVRCVYWAGVARLVEDRPARIRFTDTPRERLHVLAQPYRNIAPLPAEQLEPLRRITTRLERHWYAKQRASEHDVQQAFEDLEALGCKLD